MDSATQAMTDILDLVGMDNLQADLAVASVEDPEPAQQPQLVLVAGAWTAEDLDRLEGVATKLKQNPATVTAAEELLTRVQAARAN